jgi:hypothetical protein
VQRKGRSRWWIVIAGVVAGVVAMVLQLHRGDSLVRAFGEGLSVDFGVMIVCAVSVRLGRGDDVSDASLPGGGGIGFDPVEPIRTVNKRVDSQVSELEERVFALEKEKEAENGSVEDPQHETDAQE